MLPGDRIESVGALDLASLVAELVIAMLTSLLPPRVRSWTGTVLTAAAVTGVVVVAVLRSTQRDSSAGSLKIGGRRRRIRGW